MDADAPTRAMPRPRDHGDGAEPWTVPAPGRRPSPRPTPRPRAEPPDQARPGRAPRSELPTLTLGRVPRPAPAWPARRRRRPGEQSAGQMLVVVVAALVLAALVNADALVDRAERKPIGSDRDRSLAIWHPVQDLAHVSQLHRLRDLGDTLAGNEDRGGRVAPVTRERRVRAVPPELRVPTADDPLRVFVGGDSVVRDAGESLLRFAAEDPRLQASLHYEIATGLARPDYFDWPGALEADMTDRDPEIAIIMFGGNDAQGIVGPDGTVYGEVTGPGWAEEYGRRVGAVMDSMQDPHRLVLWVGQPPMRDAGFDRRIQVLNEVFEAEAEDRPWVRYVDTGEILGDEGRYADRLDTGDGPTEDLRQGDGIHLSRPGADRLARFLLRIVDQEIAEVAAATPTTTTSADDG